MVERLTHDEDVIARVGAQLAAWNLREPALFFLAWHAPLAFLGGQLLLAAQPFLGAVIGTRLANDLTRLFQEPENVERLIRHLEQAAPDCRKL